MVERQQPADSLAGGGESAERHAAWPRSCVHAPAALYSATIAYHSGSSFLHNYICANTDIFVAVQKIPEKSLICTYKDQLHDLYKWYSNTIQVIRAVRNGNGQAVSMRKVQEVNTVHVRDSSWWRI